MAKTVQERFLIENDRVQLISLSDKGKEQLRTESINANQSTRFSTSPNGCERFQSAPPASPGSSKVGANLASSNIWHLS